MNVNTGTLAVTGNINNSGELVTTTGTVKLSGNWDGSTGTYTPGTGTLDFNGSGAQTLNSGGIVAGKLFYNLAHSGTGTTTAGTNDVNIDGSFINTAGVFATSRDMTVNHAWTNAGLSAFTHGSKTVTLDGTDQTITGSTNFYNLTKTHAVGLARSLIFQNTGEQIIDGTLTLKGFAGSLLTLNSDDDTNMFGITLRPGGLQSMQYLTVRNSDASGSAVSIAGVELQAGTGSSLFNYINWNNGGGLFRWQGDVVGDETNWDNPGNWDLGLVPSTLDTAEIPNVTNFPVLASNVSIANLTINHASATVTLGSFNLTVSGTLNNLGTVILNGTTGQTVSIGTSDIDTGTFRYVGNGGGPTTHTVANLANYFNVVFNDPTGNDTFTLSSNLRAYGNVNVTKGQLDISTFTTTVNGSLTVDGGVLTATNGDIDVDGSVAITTGTLTAPNALNTFNVGGSLTLAALQIFTHSSGTVILDSATAATITGDITFNNLTSTTAGKTILFTAGSTQTIAGTLNLAGVEGNLLTVKSTSDGSEWNINVAAAQSVQYLSVRDSEVQGAADITCFNCTGASAALNNDNFDSTPQWVFITILINVPASGTTTDETPTIIGVANASSTIDVRLNTCAGTLVQTITANSNGDFRFEAASGIISAGAYTLVPCYLTFSGPTRTPTAVATPTSDQQPTITSHADGDRINGPTPTIAGQGLAGQTVTIKANDLNGNLLLANVGSGTVDGSGNYSVAVTTALPKGTNYLSVVVDGVSSDIVDVGLTDPFGVVFDSASNQPIEGAKVYIYKSATNTLALTNGTELAVTDQNPVTTGADGFYSFLSASANYYIVVTADGYDYPSTKTTFPAGRTIITGSKGEVFTIGSVVTEMDHPVDASPNLLRIEKDVNKSEVRIGEVVTYTITMERLGSTSINGVYIEDRIPPGFKYIDNRVTLDGTPIANPTGQRPVRFDVGTVNPGTNRTLKYQLVVGAGVTVGEYTNTAKAVFSTGQVISNTASESTKVVLDPLFDMGTIIGKVFYDRNENGIQDEPEYIDPARETLTEDPLPNVQLVMEDGTMVTTDKEGRYSIPSLVPGRHLVRLDERSLPQNSYLTTDKVVVVDVTPGLLSKVNFGVNLGSGEGVTENDQFFNEQVNITQEKERANPRLNAAYYRNEISVFNDLFADKAEFRIFTNYAPYIETWKLTISDKDTGKDVKIFEGNNFNIYDPILWDGKDSAGEQIDLKRNYEFKLTVKDKKDQYDETKAQPITFKTFEEKEELDAYFKLSKEEVKSYRQWQEDENKENNILIQNILIDGETVLINPLKGNLQSVRVMQNGQLISDIPLATKQSLSAREILETGKTQEDINQGQVEIILPKGDYEIAVQPTSQSGAVSSSGNVTAASGISSSQASSGKSYAKKLRVGEDYLMFVAMGDAKVGYTFNSGNVEPVSQDDKFNEGFWGEGKLAYFLKGKIKGKYLITSSFDTDREKKELFSKINKEDYYPVYGDASSLNREATDTQGMLYLLIQWDKSSAIWGNYSINFDDTEFAKFSRSLYGGKVDFESLSKTKFGDAKSKIVVFRAKAQQKSAHNEFLATGGSLYFMKHKDILQGSDKVRIEVRDQITGLVITSKEMVEGADYEMDYDDGRMLFWRSIPVLVDAYSIISSDLLNGNLVYVVADYEYEVKDKFEEATVGARVREAVSDHVLVGGTYVREGQETGTYQLRGADVTVKPNENATIKTEYAESESEVQNVFASTDGGLTFTELATAQGAEGKAYGISGDATLFNRLGVKSYYKWIDNDFSTSSTTSQQGKELIGLETTYDISDQTRLTFRQDIQSLIDEGTLQTQVQLGATKTSTTLLQIVHDMRRLKLTGEYKRTEVTERKDQYVSETNVQDNAVALRADYEVNDKLDVYAEQQVNLNSKTQQSTVGGEYRPDDGVEIRASKAFGTQGTSASVGLSKTLADKIKLSGDYTIFDDRPEAKHGLTGLAGEIADKANVGGANLSGTAGTGGLAGSLGAGDLTAEASSDGGLQGAFGNKNVSAKVGTNSGAEAVLGAEMDLGKDNKMQTSVGVTELVTGEKTTTVSLGGTSKVDKDTTVRSAVGMTETAGGLKGTVVGIDATQKVDDKTEYTSGITVTEQPGTDKATTLSFGTKKQLTDDLQLVTSRSFGKTEEDATSLGNTYGLVRQKDGKTLQGTLTQEKITSDKSVSDSNIFGLSGDVNDRWALSSSYERAKVQNLDGTRTQRNAIAFGAGFVKRDEETGDSLKNSTKVEARFDETSTGDVRQLLFYDTIEGKLTPEISLYGKAEYSKSRDTTQEITMAQHKEFMIGGAYRPIKYDRFNFLGRYTYLESQSPEGQVDSADIEAENAHVISMEGIFDLNNQWQVSEKFAYRISDEKVQGFDFTRTHTWLMIHRLNYKIDRDWSLGGEYRLLTQKEAQDSKRGILLEAARRIGEYAQLGLGYNFTRFSDDLTEFNYNAQGPFIRLTGKIYDRTPEEIERSYQRWMNEKIAYWAWIMVNEELSRADSPVLSELNDYYAMAEAAQQKGNYEDSQKIYKDIITAGQLMLEEASEHIRKQISQEKDLEERMKLADQYFKGGQYDKAKKILEKILEDIESGW